MSLMPAFERFPKEGEIIGKIVVGYGELEIDWAQCLIPILGNFTTVARVMYRLRTEGNRFDVGDALLKPYYERLDMTVDYDRAYSALFRCKQIRNNHAHCHWADNNGNLFYTTFEEPAKLRGDKSDLRFCHVDLTLLQCQFDLFENCQQHLLFLLKESEVRSLKQEQTLVPRPKELQLPPVHNPIETSPKFRP